MAKEGYLSNGKNSWAGCLKRWVLALAAAGIAASSLSGCIWVREHHDHDRDWHDHHDGDGREHAAHMEHHDDL